MKSKHYKHITAIVQFDLKTSALAAVAAVQLLVF